MSVVDFADQVRYGQLEFVNPQLARFVPRRESVAIAEKEKNVSGLCYHQASGL